MKISNLAILGAGVAGVSALSGFGKELGRDLHRNFGNIVLLALLVVVGLGAFALPYMAIAHLVSFHPLSGRSYFKEVILKSALMMICGLILLYVVAAALCLKITPGFSADRLMAMAAFQKKISLYMFILGFLPVLFGTIAGLMRRGKQKRAYGIYVYNQRFLDENGFSEYRGSRFSHIDRFGNKLNYIGKGPNFLEFEAANGEDAFLMIGPEGRFSEYVQPVI